MCSINRHRPPVTNVVLALLVFGLSNGTIATAAALTGQRPLLVILVSFNNKTFDDARHLSAYRSRIFGPSEPNVVAYFRENSNALFSYAAATTGDGDGNADGMVSVTMDVAYDRAPSGEEFRNEVLGLANGVFNFRAYDENGNDRLDERELTVLMIQANEGRNGKTMTAGDVTYDRVSLNAVVVPVISQFANNYTLYHELAHAVDFGSYTGRDLYNIRDGYRQKVILWRVNAEGGVERGESLAGEIGLELDASDPAAAYAISAYRDQNGELRLATWELSGANPDLKETASAGLASYLSVAWVSNLRVITAMQSGSGGLKLIVWDVNFQYQLSRRGDHMAGHATDIDVVAVSATRVIVAVRTAEGVLKLIAFDVSRDGELTRRGSYTGREANEINLVTLSETRVVAATRQADGDLELIAFDVNADGEFACVGDYHAGAATDIDLARVSRLRVATSVRAASGDLKVILFEVNDQGDVTRLGSFRGSPVHLESQTSVMGLTPTRLTVAYRDADKMLQIRTLDIGNQGRSLNEVGSASAGQIASARSVRVSDAIFATIVRVDGQIWTGNHFGMLGDNTGNALVHFDPYTKLKLGWLSYAEMTHDSGTAAVRAMGEDGRNGAIVLRDPDHRASEYFIVEYRSRASLYDEGVSDEGLAIWHIDEDKVYDNDRREPEPFVSLEWLGGTPAMALWAPRDANLRLYDDSSSPAGARWNDFTKSGISISGVRDFEGGLSFDFAFR